MSKVKNWFKKNGTKGEWLIITGAILLILLAMAVYFVGIPFLIVAVLGAFGVQANYWVGLGVWVLFGVATGGFSLKVK